MSNIFNNIATTAYYRLCILLIILAFLLVGCVYIVNSPTDRPTDVAILKCPPFEMPVIRRLPEVVKVTDKDLAIHSNVDTMLINNIKDLREWGREIEMQYKNAVDAHRAKCN